MSVHSPLLDPGQLPADPAPLPNSKTPAPIDPVLCQHCGRTASNGISCEGSCVADSGY
ncbi:MAG: hypothetical protein NTZ53_08600 [Cyanobacteria bacterium]|nr:hypothetical protein [Cyanobacteriota bacterium]